MYLLHKKIIYMIIGSLFQSGNISRL